LVTTILGSAIQFGNALAVALVCTIPLVIMWYLTDARQTPTQVRLYGNIGIFAIPLLLTFICVMIIQIFQILVG
jgi:uncharacterized membrane protein YhdT